MAKITGRVEAPPPVHTALVENDIHDLFAWPREQVVEIAKEISPFSVDGIRPTAERT